MAGRSRAGLARRAASRAGRTLRAKLGPPPVDSTLPLDGFDEHRTSAPGAELLSDAELVELNAMLGWSSFTVDGRGRRIGNRASASKRSGPQVIPDRRVIAMHERFDLAGAHVLEVGCFEGVHTIGLCRLGARVTAVDVRVANVVKTIVRCAFYGHHPTAFVCNLETWEDDEALGADLIHHVGVLYHLREPVEHLQRLGRLARRGIMLDTHVAGEDEATESMTVGGVEYRYKRFAEVEGPFAGVYDHAKWLRLEDIVSVLDGAGFDVEVVERRQERNGPRVLLMAERKPA